MDQQDLLQQAKEDLQMLCSIIGDRRVGGEGNRRATRYVKKRFQKANWLTEETLLKVMDWKTAGATLNCGQQTFEVFSSPYSPGCLVKGELLPVDTLASLQASDLRGKIVLLYGSVAEEQIMPKNFVFYNPEEHQQIIAALERGQPKAIVCATGRNSATAGGAYPFPLFEDGDFDIPSVYMKDTEGDKLLVFAGQVAELRSEAERIPEKAFNVIAGKAGTNGQRIVVSAHIDAKIGTPGAIDNATGVVVMLLLAGLMKEYHGKYGVEFVAFNGEDYYAVPGQMMYISQNSGRFDEVVLNINIDGAGYKQGLSCFSAFGLPAGIQNKFDKLIQNNPNIEEGLPWVQGDHSIFVQLGRPAVAVSSSWFINHMENQDVTHTPKDNLGIVNYERVVECALAINDLIISLNE